MTQAIATYLVRDRQGNVFGPADEATLRAWVGEGRVVAGMEIASNGPLVSRRWLAAEQHPAVADLLRGDMGGAANVAMSAGPSGAAVGGVGGGVGQSGRIGDAGALTYSEPARPKLNVLALLSTIFGAVGLLGAGPGICCCPLGFLAGVLGVGAIVTGGIGMAQIRGNPELHSGNVLAIMGLIMGILVLLIGAGAIIVALISNVHGI